MSGARLDSFLLEILVCPLTKTPLRYDAEAGELISEAAGLAYPVRDGIPIMLPEEARALKEDPEKKEGKEKKEKKEKGKISKKPRARGAR